MCGQYNVMATTRNNAGKSTDTQTPSPRIEIKISDSAGNRTGTAWLEGRDSTDHATAMDTYIQQFYSQISAVILHQQSHIIVFIIFIIFKVIIKHNVCNIIPSVISRYITQFHSLLNCLHWMQYLDNSTSNLPILSKLFWFILYLFYLLRVFENKVLMKIFGGKRDEIIGEWRKLLNAELHALYSSPNIRTSPKFTTGVKYQFHQGFWPDQRSGNPNHHSPP